MKLNSLVGSALLCFAGCSEVENEPTKKPQEIHSAAFDTATITTAAKIGTWLVSSPELISDECSVAQYQDIADMVPTDFIITQSDEGQFDTVDTDCVIGPDNGFFCEEIHIQDTALGGTARLKIATTMAGNFVSNSEMELSFDVVMQSCEGSGCFMIEMALDFPCLVLLRANAEYL